KLAFEAAVFQIEAKRNERETFFRRSSDELSNFASIQQELTRTQRVVVHVVSVRVRADMTIEQPDFAGLHESVGVLEVDLAVSGGLDFRTRKNDSRFKPFEDFVIVEGLP